MKVTIRKARAILMWMAIILAGVLPSGARGQGRVRHTVAEPVREVTALGYEGYIFPQGYIWYPYDKINDQFKYTYEYGYTHYTLTDADVRRAEEIIRAVLREYAYERGGNVSECLDHLENYARQYFGLNPSEQSKTIYVNLVNKDYAKTWDKDIGTGGKCVSYRNCYVPAAVGCEPGACTIEILVDLTSGKILALSL